MSPTPNSFEAVTPVYLSGQILRFEETIGKLSGEPDSPENAAHMEHAQDCQATLTALLASLPATDMTAARAKLAAALTCFDGDDMMDDSGLVRSAIEDVLRLTAGP